VKGKGLMNTFVWSPDLDGAGRPMPAYKLEYEEEQFLNPPV